MAEQQGSSSSCYDVAVIGAGIEGSATAWYLSKHCGQNVALLDQFSLNHTRGSSHGPTRITRYLYPQKFYVDMMLTAYPMWDELAQDSSRTLVRKTGGMSIIRNNDPELLQMKDTLHQLNIKHSLLTPDDINHRYPGLRYGPGWTGVFDPETGVLAADECRSAFQSECTKHGGALLPNSRVRGIRPGHDAVTLTLDDGGTVQCRRLVITAGPWSKNILAELGVQLPLTVERINVCYWSARKPGLYSRSSGFPVFIHHTGKTHYYGLPIDEYPGLLKLCPHHGKPISSPDHRDTSRDLTGVDGVSEFVKEHCPHLEAKPSILETCVYTVTPDKHPVLDRHPVWKNIAFGAGFSGHGFKLAPVVGQILSQLVLNRPSKYELAPFRADRFTARHYQPEQQAKL